MANDEINLGKILIPVIAGVCIAILLLGSFRIIDAGENGIRVTLGKINEVPLKAGMHLKIPIIQKIVKFEIRTQKYEADLTAASKDMQDVVTKVAINYRVDPTKTGEIYTTLGINYADRIIYPLGQEVNKATTAQFTAEELVTKRSQVSETMRNMLKDRLYSRGIIVEEISIINFQFSEEFTRAIEEKQVAEQQALTAENKYNEMEWTSKSMKLQSEVLEIKKLDIQQQWIDKWSGNLPTFMCGDSSNILFSINPQGTN